MEFSNKNFFCKCDHIQRKLRILSHLLEELLMENLIFCAANLTDMKSFCKTLLHEPYWKLS